MINLLMFQENVQWKDQLKDIDLASKEFVRKKKKKKLLEND